MYEFRHHSPNKLSGGQKQRVSIAGVIAMHPKCIILDEPTAMLDPKGRKEVIRAVLTELDRHFDQMVERLKELRLDVPQVTLLAHALRQEGFPMPKGILTKEEFREALDDCVKELF